MTIAKIDRCKSCLNLEFCDKNGHCEWCCETSEVIYSTGQIAAATKPTPAPVDDNEAA